MPERVFYGINWLHESMASPFCTILPHFGTIHGVRTNAPRRNHCIRVARGPKAPHHDS